MGPKAEVGGLPVPAGTADGRGPGAAHHGSLQRRRPRRSEAAVRHHHIDALSHGSVHAARALGPGRHARPMQAAPRDVERSARSAGPLPAGRIRRVAVRPESKELQQVRLHRCLDRDAGTGPLALRRRAQRAGGGTPRRGRPSPLPDIPPRGVRRARWPPGGRLQENQPTALPFRREARLSVDGPRHSAREAGDRGVSGLQVGQADEAPARSHRQCTVRDLEECAVRCPGACM